jgi:hypothetical protein
MQPESSLPCSQATATGATGRYPEPDEYSSHLPTVFPCLCFLVLQITTLSI